MNIFTLPQQLPNSAYTLVGETVTTPVNIDIPTDIDQAQLRDNHTQLIKAETND